MKTKCSTPVHTNSQDISSFKSNSLLSIPCNEIIADNSNLNEENKITINELREKVFNWKIKVAERNNTAKAIIKKSKKAIRSTDKMIKSCHSNGDFLINLMKPERKKQGFALMSLSQLKTVSSRGGKISGHSRREDAELKAISKKITEEKQV